MQAVSCACDDSSLSTGAGPKQRQHAIDPFQLPAPCLELILQQLPTSTRGRLRQVSRQARSAVHETTRGLSLLSKEQTVQEEQQMTHLPAWLPQCWRLQQLRLSGTTALTDLSGLPSSLQVLELSSCYALSDFSPLLACTNLRELLLERRIGRCSPVTAGHEADWTRLIRSIGNESDGSSVSPNPIPIEYHNPLWMQPVALVLPHLTTLTSFELCTDLSRVDAHREAAGQLVKAIGACSALQALHLYVLGIQHIAMQLGAALPQLQHLTLLDLSSSCIDRRDAGSLEPYVDLTWLAPGLSRLSALYALDLQDVTLNVERGLAPLAPALNALASSASLRRLDLRCTGLHCDNVQAHLPDARMHCVDQVDVVDEWPQLPGNRAELQVWCTVKSEEDEYDYGFDE